MLFWIFVALLVIGIACLVVYNNSMRAGEWVCNTGLAVTMLSALALIISIIVMCVNYIGADAYYSAMHERYDMLTYQYENNFYENDNDIGKRELIKDIQSWNEDLAGYRILQDDFWVGIYAPNIYDQFEFISLEKPDLVPIETK